MGRRGDEGMSRRGARRRGDRDGGWGGGDGRRCLPPSVRLAPSSSHSPIPSRVPHLPIPHLPITASASPHHRVSPSPNHRVSHLPITASPHLQSPRLPSPISHYPTAVSSLGEDRVGRLTHHFRRQNSPPRSRTIEIQGGHLRENHIVSIESPGVLTKQITDQLLV